MTVSSSVTPMSRFTMRDCSYLRSSIRHHNVMQIAHRGDVDSTRPCSAQFCGATVTTMRALARVAPMIAVWVGCSSDFTPAPCSTDRDCPGGTVCELRAGDALCVAADDAPIVIGHSGPITGPSQALGIGVKLGIDLAFDEQNAVGGIRGRQLVLDFRDDALDPVTAEAAARHWTDAVVSATEPPTCPSTAIAVSDGHDNTTPVSTTAMTRGPNAVLGLLGNVGSQTMLRSAAVAVETGTIYFGAVTGADKILRDDTAGDCGKYIFNVRASFAQEAQATVDLFKKRGVPGYRNIVSFDQDDAYGDAGYSGLLAAYVVDYGKFPGSADRVTPIKRFRYTRNDDASVVEQAMEAQQYIGTLIEGANPEPVGILMTDTYGAGATFIRLIREWQFNGQPPDGKRNLKIYFSNVSLVGANALADRLVSGGTINSMPATQDVYVSQVVPNYQSDSSDVVVEYNRRITATGQVPSFTSLEGYVAARIFIAGLIAHQGPFTPDSLVETFEALPNLALGIGANSGFSAMSHQYSKSVWGTSITPAGTFKNLYFWTSGSPIQFFE